MYIHDLHSNKRTLCCYKMSVLKEILWRYEYLYCLWGLRSASCNHLCIASIFILVTASKNVSNRILIWIIRIWVRNLFLYLERLRDQGFTAMSKTLTMWCLDVPPRVKNFFRHKICVTFGCLDVQMFRRSNVLLNFPTFLLSSLFLKFSGHNFIIDNIVLFSIKAYKKMVDNSKL